MNEDGWSDLPRFAEWRARFSPAPNADSYLAEHLDLTSAVLFARLMLPNFIVVRDCVLIEDKFDAARFDEWMATTGNDRIAVERVTNHLHLWDIFDPDGAVEESALIELAESIAESWRSRGRAMFPDREFHSEVTDEYGPTVVMHSI
ncbi:hypothetical protein [Isoptericola sp. BMS4]|uniref:hypothetical protein n=1 Tax=Isoptericola sp. BMS4 TaxID=2527875 RepID=UPI0014206A07|nr:hypothetical protein [Isoptericola sp. BMS4]